MKTTIQPQAMHLSRQRRLVLDILRETKGHLDADELYRKANARNARISLATVYRSLALLRKANLIQENRLGENQAHFEPSQGALHHRFTCLKCGRVVEFHSSQVEQATRSFSKWEKIRLTEVRLELHGYCANCRPD